MEICYLMKICPSYKKSVHQLAISNGQLEHCEILSIRCFKLINKNKTKQRPLNNKESNNFPHK